MKRGIIFLCVLYGLIFAPLSVSAAKLSFGVWIPYWKKTQAISEATQYIKQIWTVSPFSYEVQDNGTIKDVMKISETPWVEFLAFAKADKTKIVPTITWIEGDAIHETLASSTLRKAHVKAIAALVKENGYDGIDIDYEDKKSDTKPYFSLFLRDLYTEIHAMKKALSCTIEARTPILSRFSIVPKNLEYANDYKAINAYCDEVRIMAYDQRNVDIKLNKQKGGVNYYMPVADKDWVKKVIEETAKTINKKKIVLGVANFGYEYAVTKTDTGFSYDKLQSLTYREMMTLAGTTGSVPKRNSAGELSFVYEKQVPISTTTPTITATSTRYVVFSDATAIKDKVTLAKTYGLKGVNLFKVDGESDPALWGVLK
jgi:spore germination protein YaaH